MADLLLNDEDKFAEILAKKANSDRIKEQKYLEKTLQKAVVRNNAVSKLYEKVYEDNANGKVTDEWSHKYEVERLELKNKITETREKLDDLKNKTLGEESFIEAVRKFIAVDELTPSLLKELVEKIEVYETEGTGKNRTQRIVIYYKFVGYIEISECPKRKHYKADTREGVTVEYIPEASA